ncbi:MAG: helix-turn-helix domain-containing protein [Terrimonas sp.]|nr:helix-turn-helix domain-containing protein [Terrimonas sp.]
MNIPMKFLHRFTKTQPLNHLSMQTNNFASGRLKQLRKSLRKSQGELADELHIEQSTYSRYESGKTQLPLSVIQLIADRYHIDPSEFFSPQKPQPGLVEKNIENIPAKTHYSVPRELMEKVVDLLESITKRIRVDN